MKFEVNYILCHFKNQQLFHVNVNYFIFVKLLYYENSVLKHMQCMLVSVLV